MRQTIARIWETVPNLLPRMLVVCASNRVQLSSGEKVLIKINGVARL